MKNLLMMTTVLALFISGCKTSLSERQIQELSDHFLANCDKIEKQLAASYRAIVQPPHDKTAWREHKPSIHQALLENQRIGQQLNIPTFKSFSSYLAKLIQEMDETYTGKPLKPSDIEQNYMQHMETYHIQLEKLMPHYFQMRQGLQASLNPDL